MSLRGYSLVGKIAGKIVFFKKIITYGCPRREKFLKLPKKMCEFSVAIEIYKTIT